MKKLFALLCVIALLGALCVPAMAAAARVPVVAEVPSDWTTAYLYAWGGSETMTWPGVPMTKIDDWFVAYMNDDNTNIIINNGTGAQTADLAVDPGLPACIFASDIGNASVEPELPIEVPAEDKMPKPATDKVYAYIPDGWTTANLYAWTADASGSNAGWPGVPMTKDGDYWVGELTPGYANVIVNDGSAQTIDLPYAGGDAWLMLTNEGTNGGKFEADVLYEAPDAPYRPENPNNGGGVSVGEPYEVAYVAGTMNGWTNPDEAYKMTDNGDGTFTLTFSLTAGDHALKVTNGTWDRSVGGDGADGNYEFGMSADGEVTVNFDGSSAVTVTGDNVTEPTGNGGGAIGNVWYVAGTMNEWNCADAACQMTDNGDGTFVYTFAVTPGDYQLKVTNGTWDVCYGDPNGPEGNYAFNATDEGDVTIIFDSASTTVSHKFGGGVNPDPTPDPDPVPDPDPIPEPTPGNGGLIAGIIATVVILLGGGAAAFFLLKKKD